MSRSRFTNRRIFPRETAYPGAIEWDKVGTRALFPLGLDACLTITHMQLVRKPTMNPTTQRVNARAYQRELSAELRNLPVQASGIALFLFLVRWFDSNEQLVPFVMLSGRSRAPTWKGLLQKLEIIDKIRFHPSPVGEFVAAGAADLISKEFDQTVMNSVVVGLDNALPVLVQKPDQASLLDRCPE
jgi:hypothetical protein